MTVEIPNRSRQSPDIFLVRRQIASALHHRNILAILDIGDENGTPFVVSEYFAGDTLRSIINDEAPFDVDDVAILVEQLAQGLTYAHQRGIVHGSLTPENVVIDSAGLAKITGFGMIEGQMVSESGSRAAIPSDPYLPPNLRGNSLITPAIDVHALTSIAFEMLTGTQPSPDQGFLSPTVINPDISPRAGDTVLIALRAFDDRAGLTASQFSHALTNWRSWSMQRPIEQPRISPPPAAPPPTASPALPDYGWQDWDRSLGQEGAMPVQKRPAILRWLTLALIVMAVATAIVLAQAVEGDPAAGLADIPEELTRMLSALNE